MDGGSKLRPRVCLANCPEIAGFWKSSVVLYPFLRDRTIENFQICQENSWIQPRGSIHELAWQIAQFFSSTKFCAGAKVLVVCRFLRNGIIENFQIRGIFPGDAFEAPARLPTDEGGTKSCLPRQANQLTCNPRSVNH